MKRLLWILKITAIILAAFLLFLAVFTFAFVNMSPQFGRTPTEEQQKTFTSSSNYHDGKFLNQVPASLSMGFGETMSVLREFLFASIPGKNPDAPLPIVKVNVSAVSERSHDLQRLTWFGHSAMFLEIDGKKILLDPMLGQHAGPLPLISPKRYNSELPIEIEGLPFIDAVVISHDHYDHLDYGSIVKLKDKVGRFFVPLGVGNHLREWGVRSEIITELDWWQEITLDGFTYICTPARHFSGRGFTRNNTLWSSWVIRTSSRQLYFSGDSGYGPHFKEIGQKYGAMDAVMMECGQYNERWAAIHMTPEETVQAAIDVKGRFMLPIHWGAFTLALHTWTDPVTRAVAEAQRLEIPIATPKIGQPVSLQFDASTTSRWWE